MSGIDRMFDYSVPPPLGPRVRPGAVVRVELNGRRVDGWVIETGQAGAEGYDLVPHSRLLPLLDVADLGVELPVLPLCTWVSSHWAGPLRNVLASATPVRKKARPTNARHGTFVVPEGAVAEAVAGSWGGGTTVLRIPPAVSALDAVVACAARGSVLVVCPTLRMARLGAASLRRRGLTTAELPDQIDSAIAGVDVVIGARSAVLGHCGGLSSIVVIDEHEESLQEERVPTWSAPAVACERGKSVGVPVFLVSPVPSAAAEKSADRVVAVGAEAGGWPEIRAVDLNEVPVRGSLMSDELLETVADAKGSVLCILNSKGGARLLACKACRSLQTCTACMSTVGVVDDEFTCVACGSTRAAVCGDCGRTAFAAVRSGTTRVTQELSAASRLPVVEVTASTEGVGGSAAVWVGTDALLHRVNSASAVVFLDVDRELAAPRMSTGREVLASVARAARITGRNGRVIIQTRQPGHPLVSALVSQRIDEWRAADAGVARSLGLPPFSSVARCTSAAGWDPAGIAAPLGVEWSVDGDVLVARSADRSILLGFVSSLRNAKDARVRVEMDPVRL